MHPDLFITFSYMHHLPHVPTRKIACDTKKSIHDTEKLFINMLETEFKTAKVFYYLNYSRVILKFPVIAKNLIRKQGLSFLI